MDAHVTNSSSLRAVCPLRALRLRARCKLLVLLVGPQIQEISIERGTDLSVDGSSHTHALSLSLSLSVA